MPGSFTIKRIEVEITLAKGSFSGGGNTFNSGGLPAEVTVTKPGLPEKNKADIKVYGLKYERLDQLTTLAFRPMESAKNLIKVMAGPVGDLSDVFQGEIVTSWADYTGFPNVPLTIQAESGFYPQRMAKPPLSTNGEAKAADLISQQAGEMGYTFQNKGVTSSVRNAVFNGSPMEKAMAIARQVGADLIVDDNQVILLPQDGHRDGGVPLLSDKAGLLGYPTFNQDGITCKCHFRTDIDFGALFKLESIVPKASGTWKVTKLTHKLAAGLDGSSPWETDLEGQYAG